MGVFIISIIKLGNMGNNHDSYCYILFYYCTPDGAEKTMKASTLRRVKRMKFLMKRHEAYFWKDTTTRETTVKDHTITLTPGLYYTYPKDGWVKRPTIDGKELEYLAEHDDTPDAPLPFESVIDQQKPFRFNGVFAKVREV